MSINGTPTNFYEIGFDGCPTITEAAKRDENGQKIHETYATKDELTTAINSIEIPELEVTDANLDEKLANKGYMKSERLDDLLASLGYIKTPDPSTLEEGKRYVLSFNNGHLSWIALEDNNTETPPESNEDFTELDGLVATGDNGNVRLAAVTDSGEVVNRLVYVYDN